jgi:thiamine-phosphate pyrophosphorylase
MTSNGIHLQILTGRLRPLERTIPIISAVLSAGVDSVQLRDEGPSVVAAIQRLKALNELDRERIAVNGQPKEAGTFGMPWLHLPASWLEGTPPFARFDRVGLSVHSFDEAVEAESIGADYVTFGHVFTTPSHPGEPPRGLEALAAIVNQLTIPVLAIGGITHANVAEALATGCAGVVVQSAVADREDPGHAASRLIEVIEAVTGKPKVALPPLHPARAKGK